MEYFWKQMEYFWKHDEYFWKRNILYNYNVFTLFNTHIHVK